MTGLFSLLHRPYDLGCIPVAWSLLTPAASELGPGLQLTGVACSRLNHPALDFGNKLFVDSSGYPAGPCL
jgi:hypothetical protein